MSGLKELTNREFKDKIDENNCEIIDVRTPMEHQSGRIPNSKLIDCQSYDFEQIIDELDKDKDYYIYCRSGGRSFHAGNFMLQKGFKNVAHLKDGIIGWDGEIE